MGWRKTGVQTTAILQQADNQNAYLTNFNKVLILKLL
jgi:hypothetical protein